MKQAILLIVIFFVISCQKSIPKEKTESEYPDMEESIRLNDFVFGQTFLESEDTLALIAALDSANKILDLRIDDKMKQIAIRNKILVLGMLNRTKEAFLLQDEVIDTGAMNIDRLTYNAIKALLNDKKDVADYYLTTAVLQYNKLQNTSKPDINLFIKRIGICMIQNKDEEARSLLEHALNDNPNNLMLQDYNARYEFYKGMWLDVFETLKSQW